MNLQMTAHICGASRYEFKDDSGEVRKGATVVMLSETDSTDADRVGMAFSEAQASFDIVDKIRSLGATFPCNVDCECEMRTVKSRGGKTVPTMFITGVSLPPGAAGRHQQAQAQAKA